MGLMMMDVNIVVMYICWLSLGLKTISMGINDMSTPIIVPARKAIKQVLMFALLSYSKPLNAYMPIRINKSKMSACNVPSNDCFYFLTLTFRVASVSKRRLFFYYQTVNFSIYWEVFQGVGWGMFSI